VRYIISANGNKDYTGPLIKVKDECYVHKCIEFCFKLRCYFQFLQPVTDRDAILTTSKWHVRRRFLYYYNVSSENYWKFRTAKDTVGHFEFFLACKIIFCSLIFSIITVSQQRDFDLIFLEMNVDWHCCRACSLLNMTQSNYSYWHSVSEVNDWKIRPKQSESSLQANTLAYYLDFLFFFKKKCLLSVTIWAIKGTFWAEIGLYCALFFGGLWGAMPYGQKIF